ncbi:MAG: alpha-galactosidase [Muribaculaceae bacterium]|nr:alpha-galactosidase [Muribaculaceae bacterium]
MKHTLALLLLTGSIGASAQLHIATDNTSMLFDAEKGNKFEFVYYGPSLSDTDIATIMKTEKHLDAYPAFGMNPVEDFVFAVTHADGNMSSDLRVENVSTEENTSENSRITRVRLKDTLYPLYVDICYLTRKGCDVIETWAEFTNKENKPVTLTRFASGYLPIRRGNTWFSHFNGAWGNECQLVQEELKPGIHKVINTDGVRNAHFAHSEAMFSLDGKPDDRQGRTIGAALCYSGNYDLTVNTDHTAWHKFYAGIDPANSAYRLQKNETFTTPAIALSYSDRGTSGVSRNFHRWGRKYRLMHGDKERKVLLNSWEGVYFDVNEPVLKEMMCDIADMGGELFVLDDGWFGDKFPRDSDKQGLGDWMINRRKLPDGVNGLLKAADSLGIKFGIWIEPEMVNSKSELYSKHPDWVIKAPGRDLVYGRGGGQLVLDLGNPAVQDHVFSVFDNLMTEFPAIDYIKWDANMSVRNFGSQYHPADRQSHLYTSYHKGFENVCKRIREKYPDVTVQACAGGGGRVNWGVLPYFDEFWVSDNTDPLQRIYIQWGTSYFFPAIAMAQHISASPCHATYRSTPIKYRVDVAMSGRLGIELQPSQMTPFELDFCKKAVATYKQIRPFVQFGDQYRLHSPFDGDGVAALMYIDEAKDNAVFFWYKTEYFHNHFYPRITMDGLDPDKVYRVTELNRIDKKPLKYEGKEFTGAWLMANGLEFPERHNLDADIRTDWSSRVLRLEAVK